MFTPVQLLLRCSVMVAMTSAMVAAVATTSLGQQSDLRARVQLQQRKVRQEMEQSRREHEFRRRELEARIKKGPSARAPSAADAADLLDAARSRAKASASGERRVEYALTPGKSFAYSLLLETKSGNEHGYLAGIVAFQVEEDSGGDARISASDNLQYISNLAAFAPRLPRGSSLVKATLHVAGDGNEPAIEDSLPNMLGRPHDWFFPPVPSSVEESRSKGYEVERGSLLNKPAAWETSDRGYFQWEVKPAGRTASRLTLRDSRHFRTDDRSQELIGSGQIQFDLSDGLMSARTFAGTYTLHGNATQISLRVDRLSEQQMSELQR